MVTTEVLALPEELYARLIATMRRRLPTKSFGYLTSRSGRLQPDDFVLFDDNIRNEPGWRPRFESYGRYFVDHADAGFVATPAEAWRRQKEMWERGLTEVGVFHSHQRHPANFSKIDYDLHVRRFPNLWHLIVSMRNPGMPQTRAFDPRGGHVREMDVAIGLVGRPGRSRPMDAPPRVNVTDARDRAVRRAREVLGLTPDGYPRCADAARIWDAIEAVRATGDATAWQALVVDGFLRESHARYHDHVEPEMRRVGGTRFDMGTREEQRLHYCGESPAHPVWLSSFDCARVPVTNSLMGLFDRRRADVRARDRRSPAVDVTWYEAAVFAMWMGCRLPTEAEWEFACGAGSLGEWCCDDEDKLARYAWYSETAGDSTREVGTLEANQLDLFDLHGNVWEWCADDYDQDAYACGATTDPLHRHDRTGARGYERRKVCRGGSFLSLAEMCRTRYRQHETAGFRARDLGFRLARSVPPGTAPVGVL